MYVQIEKSKENKSKAVANSVGQKKNGGKQGFGFIDNRLEVTAQRKLQGMADNSSQVKQIIQLNKPRTIKREDDYFTDSEYQSKTKKKKNKKSHVAITDDEQRGSLIPVSESGDTDIYGHIQGSEVQKENSPFTSFTPGDHEGDKVYGQYEMEVNYDKLKESNRFDNSKIEAELKRKIKDDTGLEIDDVVPHNQIDEYVEKSGLSKGKKKKLHGRLLALANTHRDQEILVKGKIPSEAVRRIGLRMDKYNLLKQELVTEIDTRKELAEFYGEGRMTTSNKTDKELALSKQACELRMGKHG